MCCLEEENFKEHDLVHCNHKKKHYGVRHALGFGRAEHNLNVMWSENTMWETYTEFLYVRGNYCIWNPEF